MIGRVPTEAEEASVLVAYLRVSKYKFTHIANETGSGPSARFQGIRNKQQGMSKGFPDYLIIIGNKLVAIELKRTKGSATSPEQKQWIEDLNNCGVEARICKGYDECVSFIKEIEGRLNASEDSTR